jgi:Kef-type K+ transport system membrane component KefB
MTIKSKLAFPLLVLLALLVTLVSGRPPAVAAGSGDFAEIHVGARPVFMVAGIPHFSAVERADIINRRIEKVLVDAGIDPASIGVKYLGDGSPAVVLGDHALVTVTASDEAAFGESQEELARRWADELRQNITQLKPLYAHRSAVSARVLSEHRVLLLILQVAVLLLAASVCGEIMARLGQPPVIGQLMAGILLGQSVLGSVFPDITAMIFPVERTQSYLLEVVSWLGVIFLLMLTGMETDLAMIRQQGKPALYTSLLGVVLPFAVGFGIAFLLPPTMLVNPRERVNVAVFLGTVLAVSSVPVVASILMEMKLLRRNVGQIILASALAHDAAGCVILAVVAALAGSHAAHGMNAAIVAPLGTLVFLSAVYLGRKKLYALLRWVNDRVSLDQAVLTAVAVLLLLSAATTQFIGVHVVLGAFVVGVLLAQTPLVGERVIYPIQAVTMGIFAPIFFAAAGLHVNLTVLGDLNLLAVTVLFSLAACLSKVIACYVGGRLGGLGSWESLSVGLGCNARGAMGLIVGILGFSLGLLTVDLFSIIIIMALVTTAMTPPLLKWALSHVSLTTEEQTRLEQEAQHAKSFVSRLKRVLVPVHSGQNTLLIADVLKSMGAQHAVEATALHIAWGESGEAPKDGFAALGNGLEESKVTFLTKTEQAANPVEGILQEARLGYDLVLLSHGGRWDTPGSKFGGLVEQVARESPCSVLLVRGGDNGTYAGLKHILVPTTGKGVSAHACEFAIWLARGTGASVTAMCVVEQAAIEPYWLSVYERQAMDLAQDVLDNVAALAHGFDIQVDTFVRTSGHAGEEIVRTAEEVCADIVVMGGNVHATRTLFFGRTISYVLERSTGAVAVLAP